MEEMPQKMGPFTGQLSKTPRFTMFFEKQPKRFIWCATRKFTQKTIMIPQQATVFLINKPPNKKKQTTSVLNQAMPPRHTLKRNTPTITQPGIYHPWATVKNLTQPRCGEVMPKGTLVRDVNKARAALRSEEFLLVRREVSPAGGRFQCFFWG